MSCEEEDVDFTNVPAETPLTPEEAIIRRHRKEKRELQGDHNYMCFRYTIKCLKIHYLVENTGLTFISHAGKIVNMKKMIGRGDKKKKKELQDEIVKLEHELEVRHKVELETFVPKQFLREIPKLPTIMQLPNESGEGNSSDGDDSRTGTPTPGTPKMSRARKRREKKEAEAKERAKRIEEETKALEENSSWKKEEEQLALILKQLNLNVVDIPSDGHCLYQAISHQLKRVGVSADVSQLRFKTAAYLRDHKKDFIDFFDEEVVQATDGFEKYCSDIEKTAAWGGQIEVSKLYNLTANENMWLN